MAPAADGSRPCHRPAIAAELPAMSGCRLFVDRPLRTGATVPLSREQAHYLRHVMRCAPGNPITLFNGRGGEYEAEIDRLDKQGGICRVLAFLGVERELAVPVHIVQAAARSQKIETVLQKGTELGAAGFQICASEHASLKLDGARLQARLQRWRSIIIEAAEQSGRTRIPAIAWHPSLTGIRSEGLCLCLHVGAETGWAAVRPRITTADAITLAVGPEGGWSGRDIHMLESHGFSTLRFGPRTLRTETAAPALLAAVQACLDEV